MPVVFITGAGGFIGRALATRLRAAGTEVRGVDLVADPANGVVAGDVGEAGPWQDHARGADLVVHTAAVVSLRTADARGTWRANVLGTEHAVQAAERAEARLLHLSSVTVFGNRFPDQVTEDHPVQPVGLPYPDTKIASEQHVLRAHVLGRVQATIVRPGDVYGPGSRAWAEIPADLIASRRFALPGMGRGIFSPVYVDDLIEGLVAAGTSEAAIGEVLTLSGGIGVTNKSFFGHYAQLLGTRLILLPTPLARAGAAATALADRGRGEINPKAIDYLLRTGTYAIGRAQRVTGWTPATPLELGMERTLSWLTQRRRAAPR